MNLSVLIPAGLLALLFFQSCQPPGEEAASEADFQKWYPEYNRYVRDWLGKQVEEIGSDLEKLEEEIATEEDSARKKKLEETKESKTKLLVRMRSRLEIGDYFQFKEKGDLPDDLEWKNGSEQPEIGDPESKKGGAFRYFISSFPPTIRPFGPNSNNSFRGELYDNVEVALVELHPGTGEIMPGVAKEWALSRDRKTVFFRLDPDAKYNDGVPVKAVDFMWWVYLRASDNVVTPWFKQYIREQWSQFTLYGDDLIAISLPEPKPKLAYFASLPPSAPHFYKEYGPDYKERYQWRVPPTTAAYTVKPEDLVKGVSITLSRVDDWWAADKKFYRYRFNADRIRYTVVRDRSKAWELFRAGEIDYFPITLPEYWYQKSEMPPVFDGYVERYTWYNQFPRIPWSLYLNCAQAPLDDHDVRLGISHATNWQKVIDVIFRGTPPACPVGPRVTDVSTTPRSWPALFPSARLASTSRRPVTSRRMKTAF